MAGIYLIHIHSKKKKKKPNKKQKIMTIMYVRIKIHDDSGVSNKSTWKKKPRKRKNILVLPLKTKIRLESVRSNDSKSVWNVTCTGWMKVRDCGSMVAGPPWESTTRVHFKLSLTLPLVCLSFFSLYAAFGPAKAACSLEFLPHGFVLPKQPLQLAKNTVDYG